MRWPSPDRLFLLLSVLFVGLMVGCDQEPVTSASEADVPSNAEAPEPMFSHGQDGMATATARYVPIDGSGVQGVVAILDDGSKTVVSAVATGLDPGNADGYNSLFYDRASQLRGPLACEPGKNVGTAPASDHPLALTFPQMIIGSFDQAGPSGLWEDPEADGIWTLGPVETAAYVSVDRIGTISIRDMSIDGFLGPGTGPDAVVACGKVTTN